MELIDKYTARLTGRVPDQYLETIRTELEILLTDYDITRRTTELVVYDGRSYQILTYYIASLRVGGKQPKTLEHYRDTIVRFLDTVGKPLVDITTVDVRKYLYDLSCAGTAARSAENYRSILSGFFSFCVEESYLPDNPCARIKRIKYNPAEVEPLTDEEMDRLRRACGAKPNGRYVSADGTVSEAGLKEQELRRVKELMTVEVLYGTGLRVSELIGLKVTDVSAVKGTVTVIKKGGAVHRPPISDAALKAMAEYLSIRPAASEWVFDSPRDPSRHVTRAAIEKMLKNLGDEAGIEGLHPHRIRHTTATKCLQGGMPLEEVSQMLGHRSLNTTLIYAKRDMRSLQQHHRDIL